MDSSTHECELCSVKFAFFNRKHHCRKCGSVVCHDCSTNKALLQYVDAQNKVRICDHCFIYKTGTLNMGITESNDYTVDLTGLIDDNAECEDTYSFNNSFNSSSAASSKRLSASTPPVSNRNSMSSRYRDSLNSAEVKNIEAARNASKRNSIKEEDVSYPALSWCCCCCSIFNDTTLVENNSNTDPLLTKHDSYS